MTVLFQKLTADGEFDSRGEGYLREVLSLVHSLKLAVPLWPRLGGSLRGHVNPSASRGNKTEKNIVNFAKDMLNSTCMHWRITL